MEYLPFIIPLAAIQFGLMIFVIIDILRKKKTKTLSPLIWIVISVAGSTVGPVLYIIFGRADAAIIDDDDSDDI